MRAHFFFVCVCLPFVVCLLAYCNGLHSKLPLSFSLMLSLDDRPGFLRLMQTHNCNTRTHADRHRTANLYRRYEKWHEWTHSTQNYHSKVSIECVLKSSHHSSSSLLLPLSVPFLFFCLQMCNFCARNATQYIYFFPFTKAIAMVEHWALSKFPSFLKFSTFYFLLLVIVWLILLLQNGYFIFICVQSSLRQFYSLVAKLHFDSVTVEKWAMNARHLFECEFHWQSFFFALVCSLLFSQSTESGWRRREEEKMTGKYHFWW